MIEKTKIVLYVLLNNILMYLFRTYNTSTCLEGFPTNVTKRLYLNKKHFL